MTSFVVTLEYKKSEFPFRIRNFVSCRRQKYMLQFEPTRQFWTSLGGPIPGNCNFNIRFDFRIGGNVPFMYQIQSSNTFFPENCPFPDQGPKGAQFLTIKNTSSSPITRADGLTIRVVFIKNPDKIYLNGKLISSAMFRKKCF